MRTMVDSDQPEETPVETLARIAAAKGELAREEAVAVRRARVAGLSWAVIGTLLGVSKQAIHQKYGRRA
jgi:hypothetical protein